MTDEAKDTTTDAPLPQVVAGFGEAAAMIAVQGGQALVLARDDVRAAAKAAGGPSAS